jgi:hypothetical protein
LPFEHLGHQVIPNRPVGARELGDEPFRVRVTAERDHRETQAGGPAFGAPLQRGHAGVGQVDPGRDKQFARLVLGEP